MTEIDADPSVRLETTFQHIAATRMADVPILNPALEVAAVGFRPWREYWLGVLVTPWFMNLVACPEGDDDSPELSRRVIRLPSGDYEFTLAREDDFGAYLACPLISPMSQFAGQDDALAVAEEVLRHAFQGPEPVPAPPAGAPDMNRRGFIRALLPVGRSK